MTGARTATQPRPRVLRLFWFVAVVLGVALLVGGFWKHPEQIGRPFGWLGPLRDFVVLGTLLLAIARGKRRVSRAGVWMLVGTLLFSLLVSFIAIYFAKHPLPPAEIPKASAIAGLVLIASVAGLGIWLRRHGPAAFDWFPATDGTGIEGQSIEAGAPAVRSSMAETAAAPRATQREGIITFLDSRHLQIKTAAATYATLAVDTATTIRPDPEQLRLGALVAASTAREADGSERALVVDVLPAGS